MALPTLLFLLIEISQFFITKVSWESTKCPKLYSYEQHHCRLLALNHAKIPWFFPFLKLNNGEDIQPGEYTETTKLCILKCLISKNVIYSFIIKNLKNKQKKLSINLGTDVKLTSNPRRMKTTKDSFHHRVISKDIMFMIHNLSWL